MASVIIEDALKRGIFHFRELDRAAEVYDGGFRVYLERPSARHERDFVDAVLRSRALHRGFVVAAATPAEYRDYLRSTRRDDRASFFVVTMTSGGLAGVVDFRDIVDGRQRSGRLGYYAFTPYAGSGLMREGLTLAIGVAFRRLGVRRLEADVQSGNRRSIALLERLGFAREGTAHGYLKIGNCWRDHQRWALVAEDWRAR
jgi:[ribosomal protein S5]-alanine N-acetyltransferase